MNLITVQCLTVRAYWLCENGMINHLLDILPALDSRCSVAQCIALRAGQCVGIYRTGAISLKYRDAISKKYNKTDYRDIEISQ